MSNVVMELECFKYNEKMSAEDAFCRHPGDYCKYRTSCMIQFMGGEKKANKISVLKKADRFSLKEKSNIKK